MRSDETYNTTHVPVRRHHPARTADLSGVLGEDGHAGRRPAGQDVCGRACLSASGGVDPSPYNLNTRTGSWAVPARCSRQCPRRTRSPRARARPRPPAPPCPAPPPCLRSATILFLPEVPHHHYARPQGHDMLQPARRLEWLLTPRVTLASMSSPSCPPTGHEVCGVSMP